MKKYNYDNWSTLAKIVYKRTYSRNDEGISENWDDTVKRYVEGNIRNFNVSTEEKNKLIKYGLERKGTPAGRGIWASGSPNHKRIGGTALNNCWGLLGDDWNNIIMVQDLLMLGGGVGVNIQNKYVSKLPRIKKDVHIENMDSKDADFIVPDSREGWNALTKKILESYFVTGESFTYSTICIRGRGEKIHGFGGKSSGPGPLKEFVKKACNILENRAGKTIRSIDAGDLICAIGEMVVAGNVRRSAIILIGDPYDKEYLKAKRWDIQTLPTQRAQANYSVNVEDIDDLHPLFWKTYEIGEPFGIVNLKNFNIFGRMGEKKKDNVVVVNPCSEIGMDDGEPCNLTEIALPNLKDENEFEDVARILYRYAKRVTLNNYHWEKTQKIIKKNMRIGVGITGCLQSSLFNEKTLDKIYKAIEDEDEKYSKELGVNKSVKYTTIKPSGTLSLIFDTTPGIHPSYSKYYIRRIRFDSDDKLLDILRKANHYIEPQIKFDDKIDEKTMVVDFPMKTKEGTPVADEDWNTWKQLDVVKNVQKWWSDNSVSVTVYYNKDEVKKIKNWLIENLAELKSVSFLVHMDHGFRQAPLEAITQEKYEEMIKKLNIINFDEITYGGLENMECSEGSCPIK